ncbi:MAG: recombinase family protein [Ruthenibacterium sp.]
MKKKILDITPTPIVRVSKKKVAAYARVSCDKDTMLHSLAAQIDYYRTYICNNADWEFAGIYADEAKTGTKDEREQFQLLLSDCKAGKIDMVVTKSVSRFARNTVTLLTAVRMLRSLGIDVFFEEQNIYTLSAEGEVLLTLLASFAQAESLSCSDNVKWRIRSGFRKGKASTCTMLGYRLIDGEITLIADEAELVKRIYTLYLDGCGMQKICNILNHEGVPTRLGYEWHVSSIRKILTNEKYIGDLRLQKTLITDHLTKRQVPNIGQLPQFYIESDHAAIIERDMFEAVACKLQQRKSAAPSKPASQSVFSGKVHCGICKKNYRRKTTPYNVVWRCSTYDAKGKQFCASKSIPETVLQTASAEILGLAVFDAEAFATHVEHVDVLKSHLLRFVLYTGEEIEYQWKDRSRSESWTDEMRETARQDALRRSL